MCNNIDLCEFLDINMTKLKEQFDLPKYFNEFQKFIVIPLRPRKWPNKIMMH